MSKQIQDKLPLLLAFPVALTYRVSYLHSAVLAPLCHFCIPIIFWCPGSFVHQPLCQSHRAGEHARNLAAACFILPSVL